MLPTRLACRTPFHRLAHQTSIRMSSTIVGRSGRVYIQSEVLQRHPHDRKHDVFKAESENASFVFKRVPQRVYDVSLSLASELAGSPRLRMHIDCNPEEGILLYPYFKGTLLGLIREDPQLPPLERVKILRRVGEAIQELHRKDRVHVDVKPDNIFVNWTCDDEGNKTVTDAALGDFDIAFQSEGGRPLRIPYAVGNAMWRSPEGQTGKGVTKASDIYSFGLVCIYALGGGEFLLLRSAKELEESGILPEQDILTRHFCYFGPASGGLLKQVDDEAWCRALKAASKMAEFLVKADPELRFERWGSELGAEGLDMISGMTNPDPTARLTIDQVLRHSWWQQVE